MKAKEVWTERLRGKAVRPRKVVFAYPGNGYPYDQRVAAEHLTPDAIYTLIHMDMQAFHTTYWLREVPGVGFNSVLFKDASKRRRTVAPIEATARSLSPPTAPRTLKDDVAKELREKIAACRFHIPDHVRVELTADLTPLVCELIDHALQVDRVGRGLLPYDEE